MARQMFVLHPAAPLYKRQNTQSNDATRGISTCQRTVALPIESKCACCILQYTKRKAKHSSSAMPPAASPHASGPQHCRRQDKYLCGLMPRIDKNRCCGYPNCIATTRHAGLVLAGQHRTKRRSCYLSHSEPPVCQAITASSSQDHDN